MSYRPVNSGKGILQPYNYPRYCPECRRMTNNGDHGAISKAWIYMVTPDKYDDEPCVACRWKTSPLRGALSICDDPKLAGAVTCSGNPE
jgi:hypothetical protein